MAAGDLEAQVEQLYERIQLPKSWLKRLREELEAEITARQHRNAAEREFLTRKLAKADTERRKLLDAYYANAIDVTTLKAEQARIAADVRSAEERLAACRRPPGRVAGDPGNRDALRHQLRQGLRPSLGADQAPIQPSRLQPHRRARRQDRRRGVPPALRPALFFERVRIRRFGGGERTRTADFHVANVSSADCGGLGRTIMAGQRVIHTPANECERRRPRDDRGMTAG